eukprot:TRINITY_DN2234_c1_g1_i1.p1 TRINITY_DN2234_c1_g1~~TRINITY_DN2234_c1_g1_i1.p1  ORF type:complete len:237 (-),score=51.99 TRINITY_DN2234_c1_g1_i1:3-659(-)
MPKAGKELIRYEQRKNSLVQLVHNKIMDDSKIGGMKGMMWDEKNLRLTIDYKPAPASKFVLDGRCNAIKTTDGLRCSRKATAGQHYCGHPSHQAFEVQDAADKRREEEQAKQREEEEKRAEEKKREEEARAKKREEEARAKRREEEARYKKPTLIRSKKYLPESDEEEEEEEEYHYKKGDIRVVIVDARENNSTKAKIGIKEAILLANSLKRNKYSPY